MISLLFDNYFLNLIFFK